MIIISILVVFVTIILLITLTETIIWWYLWYRHSKLTKSSQISWKNTIIFLTGISDYAKEDLQPEQIEFLQDVNHKFNADIMIAESFPYEKLTAQKFSKFDFWRYLGLKELPLLIISLHNFWQTLLVTGLEEIYGNAIADCIVNKIGLNTSPDSNLLFICGSIGANLALAAAPKLKEKLQVNLIIITYGGFFRASSGFDYVDKFYHLIGTKDIWTKLGKIIFPGRYLPIGTLAKAKKEKRFSIHYTGNHKHLEYLSDHICKIQTKTYRQLTLNTLTNLSVWQKKD